jgi:hypothetical protein
VIDTYSKMGFAKLYTRKTPLTAADVLNDRVIAFLDEHDIRVDRILTDRGTEYCGAHDRHEYELYLAVEDIDHLPDDQVRLQDPLIVVEVVSKSTRALDARGQARRLFPAALAAALPHCRAPRNAP